MQGTCWNSSKEIETATHETQVVAIRGGLTTTEADDNNRPCPSKKRENKADAIKSPPPRSGVVDNSLTWLTIASVIGKLYPPLLLLLLLVFVPYWCYRCWRRAIKWRWYLIAQWKLVEQTTSSLPRFNVWISKKQCRTRPIYKTGPILPFYRCRSILHTCCRCWHWLKI